MAEYIEREATLAILRKNPTGTWRGVPVYSDDIKAAIHEVENLPAADVAPVVHGEWVDNGEEGYKWAFICSECGWSDGYPFSDRHRFCPSCGAKMQEVR